jgi:DNA-binding PadR family transcriptional regulator
MELNGTGNFQYLMLRAIVKLGEDATAKRITYTLRVFLGRRLDQNQVYLSLSRLTKKGYIVPNKPAKQREQERQVITYSATEAGLQAIESHMENLRDLLAF